MKTETIITPVQSLPLVEAFYTIQGEGFHQGKAAYFIRLGGCDVGCVWCDVKESWDASAHPLRTVTEMVGLAKKYPGRIAVVTGGEPLMHDCLPLTRELHAAGFQTHIETSGAYPLSGEWDWICLSPKKFKHPLQIPIEKADELKVVIYHPSDFKWAESYAEKVNPACKLFLQPEWSKREIITPLISSYIMDNPRWEFSLQLHKYIQMP
ncbi:MAG TPA: 7-carboxy-7-deazaguanine synthase QueE [Puia sp.]